MIPVHQKQESGRYSDPRETARMMHHATQAAQHRQHPPPVSAYPYPFHNNNNPMIHLHSSQEREAMLMHQAAQQQHRHHSYYLPQPMGMPSFAHQQQARLMALSTPSLTGLPPPMALSSAPVRVPKSPPSAAPAPAAGTKQRDMEAAELLLGLTSKDGADEQEASGKREPAIKSAASIGHVTDESSTGTLSRTSSPFHTNHHHHIHHHLPIPTQDPTPSVPTYDTAGVWYNGSVSLSLPEDDDVLSPLHCFMRKYCVEAFSATAQDVATPRYGKSHGFKVEVGQVGIRCLYCKNLPVGKRPERAVCYPSSLKNIYHSIETWQRRHSQVCTHISPWVKKSMVELMESSKTRAGGRRKYWEDSANRLGMEDTNKGVRFMRHPGDLGPVLEAPTAGEAPQPESRGGSPIVREDDKDLVTDYLYLLMEQMQTCHFTEEDRTGGRSKIKDISLDFPGYECKHCHGRAGFGRYFPSSVSALSLANSDRNVFNHLQKCRRCPQQIKNELIRRSKAQTQSKNRRGLRKLFFNRIWDRMHDDEAKPAVASHSVSLPGAHPGQV